MRKYKITTYKKEIFYIEADTPLKALEKMYSEYNIKVSESNKEKATHMIELLDSCRNSKKFYIVNIEALNRKGKPDNYIEPMPKKQLQKVIKDFKLNGGTIKMDEESERHLKSQNAEGSTLNENIILLVRNPSRSVVYEELIHAEQYRQGKMDGSYEKRLLCEIEAQKKLIERKKEYGITDIEDAQTRKALKNYQKEYNEFKKQKIRR